MLEFFRRARRLQQEILGINVRNRDFVYPLNHRRYFPSVNDKLLAKQILSEQGLPVPRTLWVGQNHADLDSLDAVLDNTPEFVIKPAQGSGGRGICIMEQAGEGRFLDSHASGPGLSREDVQAHIADILAGVYSLEKLTDRAYLEERLRPDRVLGQLTPSGLPDIRVLMHRGWPVMAMARIPTRSSGGRANLHQGAIGLGIEMRTGQTTHAIVKNKVLKTHPDTGQALPRVTIPYWERILDYSRQAAHCFNLGYLGIDVAIDQQQGPLILELNARPGLSIQLANQQGLVAKLYSGRQAA